MERVAVEHVGKLVEKRCVVKSYCAEDVGCFALSVGRNAWLHSDGRPRLMQGTVEPEAGLVLKKDNPSAIDRFFLLPEIVRQAIASELWHLHAPAIF